MDPFRFWLIKRVPAGLVWTRKRINPVPQPFVPRAVLSTGSLGQWCAQGSGNGPRDGKYFWKVFPGKKREYLIYVTWYFSIYIIILMWVIYTVYSVYSAVALCLRVWDPASAGHWNTSERRYVRLGVCTFYGFFHWIKHIQSTTWKLSLYSINIQYAYLDEN